MNVTAAKHADLKDMLEMLTEYQESLESITTVVEKKNERYLKQLLDDGKTGAVFIGRTSSKHPVGFVIVNHRLSTPDADLIPNIQDLYVRESYRRKGFGRQLFEHVVRWAKKNGHSQLRWQVENLNLTAQYMFDSYNPAVTGWVGYSLNLKKE